MTFAQPSCKDGFRKSGTARQVETGERERGVTVSLLRVSIQQAIPILKLRPLRVKDKVYLEGIVDRTMKPHLFTAPMINVFSTHIYFQMDAPYVTAVGTSLLFDSMLKNLNL